VKEERVIIGISDEEQYGNNNNNGALWNCD